MRVQSSAEMDKGFSRSVSASAPGALERTRHLATPNASQILPTPGRYDKVAIALHWLMAIGVTAQFALGWWMIGLADEGAVQRSWFNLHKSIGLTLGTIALARLAWRVGHPAPPLPSHFSSWERRAARCTHAGLYTCLLLLPLVGYLGSSFSGYPVRFFGIVLPAWGWKWPVAKDLFATVHLILTWLLAGLVALHVSAALVHLARRDGVFARMWPSRRKAGGNAEKTRFNPDGGSR